MATQAEITAFLIKEFPQSRSTVLAVGNMGATVKHTVGEQELRPGGTVSDSMSVTNPWRYFWATRASRSR